MDEVRIYIYIQMPRGPHHGPRIRMHAVLEVFYSKYSKVFISRKYTEGDTTQKQSSVNWWGLVFNFGLALHH